MYEKVCDILLNYVDEPEGGFKPDMSFLEDLAMNSLDIMTMVGDLEDEFDITIETADLRGMHTLQDLVDFLEAQR